MGGPCAAEVVDHRIPAAEALAAYDSGRATLTAGAAPAVDAVACLLAGDPTLTVQVEVHTDSRGADVWNLRLSQERADAFRAAVVARGADAARVTAVGYGESLPLDPSDGTAAANRRVELHTEPPSARPPRPPAPQPAEPPSASPTAPVDACAGWRTLGDSPPGWASCSTHADGWRCVLPVGLAQATERVRACFPGAVDQDGTLLVLHAGATLLLLDVDPQGRAILSRGR